MIISASRRTDIPAFYSEWFMNRIEAGFLLTRNPFNYQQIRRIELMPSAITAIVFWTRNPTRLLASLDKLDSLGYRYYFQFTITGYPKALESATLNTYKAIDCFKKLSDKIGAKKVIWRYDPILLSNRLPYEEHIRLFSKLADSLTGYTERVVVSFADIYQKVERNLNKVDGLQFQDIVKNKALYSALAHDLTAIAHRHNMTILSCAEDADLSAYGIDAGKCIDDALIADLFKLDLNLAKDPHQREQCGCVKSVDIGMYNTCLHGCKYCYATFNEALASVNYKKHDPNSPFLIGGPEGVAQELLRSTTAQPSLF